MAPLLLALGTGVALIAWRALAVRRWERAVGARLPAGPAGIVPGAEPYEFVGAPDAPAVLLLHGFGDTPQSMRYLAAALHAEGCTVRAPLLPGHGRTLREFARSGADAWIAHARAELAALRARHRDVALVGLSMGGAISALLAAETPDVRALVMLAPYVSMPDTVRRAARVHRLVDLVFPYIPGGGERSIHDPVEQARNLAYGVVAPRLIRELLTVVERAQSALPRLQAPTLVIQSREDNRIPADAAERAFGKVGAPVRHLEWLTGCGHLITVDHGYADVAARVTGWVAEHVGSLTSAERQRA